MCLNTKVTDKELKIILKGYKPRKSIKGYKIVSIHQDMSEPYDPPWGIYSPVLFFKWKKGWNKMKNDIGIHVFLDKKDAMSYWDCPAMKLQIMTVYFYKSNIITIGTDKGKTVTLVDRCLLRIKDYEKTIERDLAERQILAEGKQSCA